MHPITEESITVIVDTREQSPLSLEKYGFQIVRKSLPFGDYSVVGLEKLFVVERKSLPDFVACCTRERERFARELLALRGFRYRFVLCEFGATAIWEHLYRSNAGPLSLAGSIARWLCDGVSFLLCDNPEMACYVLKDLILFTVREIVGYSEACMTAMKDEVVLED